MKTDMEKENAVARQIVCMLMHRKRQAYRLWNKYKGRNDEVESQLYGHWIEAWNAAELARRILYGYDL